MEREGDREWRANKNLRSGRGLLNKVLFRYMPKENGESYNTAVKVVDNSTEIRKGYFHSVILKVTALAT